MTKRKLPIREAGGKEGKKGLSFLLVFLVVVAFTLIKISQASWVDDRYYLMAVVGDEKISVIGVNASSASGYELVIPGNMMVPVVGMQGDLKANSLWQFGKDEGEPERIVEYSLERLLGVEISGVIKTRNNLSWFDIWKSRGNGELVDRVKWLKTWRKLRDDQRVSVGVPSSILTQKRNPDGEEVALIDETGIKNLVSDFWLNSGLLNERVGVEVINASGIEGMGKLAESMIKAAGGLVLKIDSIDNQDGSCWYAGREELKSSQTANFIEQQFGCVYKDDEEVISGLKMWLGKEWGEKYKRS